MSCGPFRTGLASEAKGGVTDSSTVGVVSSLTSATYVSSVLTSESRGERPDGGLSLSFLEEPERLFDMVTAGIRNLRLSANSEA